MLERWSCIISRMSKPKSVVSDRIGNIFGTGSAIRKMFEEGIRLKRLHGSENVADLSLGNPEFPPPTEFTQALRAVSEAPGQHAYMLNAGYPHVRAKVAAALKEQGYFENIETRHIVMTTGAAGALNVVLETILDPGDEVIVPRPYFVEYGFYIESHGGKMVLVDTQRDFNLDVESIAGAVSERTRAILLNSPHNPTGRIYSRASLSDLSSLLGQKEKDLGRVLFLLSDEPYREILFDNQEFVSPASIWPNSFMCYSWSKSFSIPGERIGYIAVNPAMHTEHWSLLLGSLAMCNRFLGFVNAPALMQHVIAQSMDAEIDISHYIAKKERLCSALDKGGYEYQRPEGTFYIFPKTPGSESEFMARSKDHLLLVVPGKAFGQEGYFRMSFTCSDRTVDLACKKLVELAQ